MTCKTIHIDKLTAGVCQDGQDAFRRAFGEEVVVDTKNCLAMAHKLRFDYGATVEAGLLTPKQREVYLELSTGYSAKQDDALVDEIEHTYNVSMGLFRDYESMRNATTARDVALDPLRQKRREDCALWFCAAYNSG